MEKFRRVQSLGEQECMRVVYGSAGRTGAVCCAEATRDCCDGRREENARRAVSAWSIALVMWPNASLRNYGKHEVVTVNTSHQLLRVESDHISGPQEAHTILVFKERAEHHHVMGERKERIARRHGRTRARKSETHTVLWRQNLGIRVLRQGNLLDADQMTCHEDHSGY